MLLPKDAREADEARALYERLLGFMLPGGAPREAHDPTSISLKYKGAIRATPMARWSNFAAEEEISAVESSFCWRAQLQQGAMRLFRVTDRCEKGRGELTIALGKIFNVNHLRGPELDQGELQRYLSSFIYCPMMLILHPTLACRATPQGLLRLWDAGIGEQTFIEVEIGENGAPTACRALRPRMVGKKYLLTDWRGAAYDWIEREGERLAGALEVYWTIEGSEFAYYRAELPSMPGDACLS